MPSSRRLAAIFLCVFLLGALAGGLLTVNLYDFRFYKFLNRTNDPVSLAARINKKLAKDYQLDAGQQARIVPLTQQMTQKLYVLRRQFASDVLSTLDDSHQKIGQEMTPVQRAAYQKANDDRHQRYLRVLMPEAAPTAAAAH